MLCSNLLTSQDSLLQALYQLLQLLQYVKLELVLVWGVAAAIDLSGVGEGHGGAMLELSDISVD